MSFQVRRGVVADAAKCPVRVMHLVLSLEIGGAEKVVHDLATTLDPHLVSSTIVCLDQIGHFGQSLLERGFPVYCLHRKPGIDWTLARQLCRIIDAHAINLIHAQQYTPYFYGLLGAWHRWPATTRSRPRIILTEHGIEHPYRKRYKRTMLNPLLFRFASAITTISGHTKQTLVDYESYPASRVLVIPNGVDTQQFSNPVDLTALRRSLGLDASPPTVGIVARLDPVKNHAMLLRAFKDVLGAQPDCRLIIVGDGPENDRLRELSSTLAIDQNVLFLGSRMDVKDLLRLFDVFALPSFSEGMSAALIEAMAAGLPIVATNVGANSEVVADELTGFLIPSGDQKALSDRLLVLLGSPQLREKMAAAGRERALRMFSLRSTIDTYTSLYLKTVCKHTGGTYGINMRRL